MEWYGEYCFPMSASNCKGSISKILNTYPVTKMVTRNKTVMVPKGLMTSADFIVYLVPGVKPYCLQILLK